jgi:hypothetical protein
VHGGDRDGSIWETISRMLCDHGNKVFCPSMQPIKTSTLQHNINEICQLIETEQLDNIFLVGHSYGAMVITGVLEKFSDRIHCMVYVDSVIPKNGKSLFGLLEENNFDYKNFGLTPDAPCIEPLYFDENKLNKKLKAYIHCLQSEFLQIAQPVYNRISKNPEWICFSLDTTHSCMLTQPKALAIILAGLQVC